jgi:hypothetical protein
MEQKPKEGDREFSGRGMASIFGAPISWIALFGALMGALSIVPMVFYPFGGGFASAGMIIFGPMSGLVLGPWAGAVAGLVGGLIGMFISPGSYPLGLIDVFLSGVFLPIFWGLAKPYYRKFYIPFTLLWIAYYIFCPYYIPGQAAGFGAVRQPMYFLSFIWGPLGLLFVILMQKTLLKWMKAPQTGKRLLGYILYMAGPTSAWLLPWIGVYFWALKYPPQTAELNNWVAWYFYILPISVATGIVAMLLIRALEKSGLRRVPGGILDSNTD